MDVSADLLRACIRETPVRVRLPFGSFPVWPAAAVDVAEIMARDAEGDLLSVFGGEVDIGNDEFLEALLTSMSLRRTFLALCRACARGWKARVCIAVAFAQPKLFREVALACLFVSVPQDVSPMFEAKAKGEDDGDGDGDVMNLPRWVVRTAGRLRASGHPDVDRMSLTRLAFAAMLEAEGKKEALKLNAVAARVGQADEKGWKKFTKSLE